MFRRILNCAVCPVAEGCITFKHGLPAIEGQLVVFLALTGQNITRTCVRDDFDIVNFPFLDGDAPRRTSYGVYIYQPIRFARASSNVSDFNCRNKALTAKLLKQGYRYHKLRKAFSKFYRRHSELEETSATRHIGTRFYGDLVYRIRKFVGKSIFFGTLQKMY